MLVNQRVMTISALSCEMRSFLIGALLAHFLPPVHCEPNARASFGQEQTDGIAG
jgi:hypothetical protein